MENNQNKQQRLSELAYSRLTPSRRREIVRLASWNSLQELMKHRPMLVLTGVWVSLIVSATIAAFSLSNTGHVEQQETTPTPVAAENPAENSSQTGNPLHLWLLGAFVLTSAAGSVVISKHLNRSLPPRQRKHTQNSSARVLKSRTEQPLAPGKTEPVVTVLPPEESQPLDSGEESLAEMMDMRKQRSLSSILQKRSS